MSIVSAIFRIIIGAAFGLLSYLALSPALAAFIDTSSDSTGISIALGVCVLLGAFFGFMAPTIRRAFGWGFLELGLATFALPLSTMLLGGKVAAQMTEAATAADKGATLLGAGIGASLMTGAAAIVGFFLGAIFLIIALILLLGGRREVILVDRASGAAVAGTARAIDTSKWSKRDREAFEGRQRGRIEPPLQ